MNTNYFRVQVLGAFCAAVLLDSGGRYVYDLLTAKPIAERDYGAEWITVFNGLISLARNN